MKKIYARALIAAAITLFTATAARAQVTIDGWPLPPAVGSLGTISIGQFDGFGFTASNESGPLTWSITSGALPTGLALRADVGPWMLWADVSISGVATVPGDYAFRLQVSDGSSVDFRDFTMKVTGLALADHWNLPDAFLDNAYSSYTLTALNAALPASFSAPPADPTGMPPTFGGLPPGMTLSAGGVLSGTPTVAGFYNIPITVSDGTDTVTFYRNLTVNTIRIAPGLLVVTQGVAFVGDIEATGGSGSFTYTASFLPNGLAINAANGDITGTTTWSPGRYGVTVTATDTNSVSAFRNISLWIVGSQPSLMSVSVSDRIDCTFGTPCVQTVFANNGGVPPISWSATGLPPGMGIRFGDGATTSWTPEGAGEIWGTATTLGPFEVFVTATDSAGKTATQHTTIHVSPLWISNFFPNAQYGVSYPPQQPLRVIGGTPFYTATELDGSWPSGMSLDTGTLELSGSPQETGSFSRTVMLEDTAGNTLRAWLNLFVMGPNTTLQINENAHLGYITQNQFYSRQLMACCVPFQSWSVVSGPLPPGLVLNSNGLLSGTPTTSGTYSFLARVEDADFPLDNFAQKLLTIVVTPLSVTTNFTLPFGQAGAAYPYPSGAGVQLAVTGGTAPYNWTLVPFQQLPPGLTLSSGGMLSGTPAFAGYFNFSLFATDSLGNTQRAFFNVSIFPPGEYPPINLFLPTLSPMTLGTTVTQSLSATGGSGGYVYSYTPGFPEIPGLRVQNGQPLPTFITTGAGLLGVMATTGTFETSIRVTDSVANVRDFPWTVWVLPFTVLSQNQIPKATLNQSYSFTLEPFGGSGNYSWVLESPTVLPAGVALHPVTGEISGTPTAAGTFNFTVRLTDLDHPTAPREIRSFHTLVVDPFAITNNGLLPMGTVGTPYNVALAAAPDCGGACAWTLTSGGLPGGLSLLAGVISGTPTQSTNTTVTIQAAGPGGTVSKVFSLQIVGNPPNALSLGNVSQSMNTRLGSTVANLISTQGGTPPYSLSVLSGTLPAGVTLQLGANVGSGQSPGVMHLAGRPMTAGVHTFTLQAMDSFGATAVRTITWNVETHQFDFTTLPLAATTLQYQVAYVQPLLVYGGTSDYMWSAPSGMPPGLLLDPSTGVVSGTPTNTGSFSLPVRVDDDNGAFVIRNVNFNIAGPTATTFTFNQGASLGTLSVGGSSTLTPTTSNGTGAVTITVVGSLPPGFALLTGDSLVNTGATFVVAMTPLAAGPFSFTLQAEDSAMPTHNIAVRTFSGVAVALTNVSTTVPDGSIGVAYSHRLHIAGANQPLTFSISPSSAFPLPNGLTLSSDGVISGTPTSATAVSGQTVQILATDTLGNLLSVNVNIRVSPMAITDPQVLPDGVVNSLYTHTFSVTGAVGTVTWTGQLPQGFTLSSPGGQLSGTPTGGVLNFTVTATTPTAAVTKRFAINVQGGNQLLLSFGLLAARIADVIVGQTLNFSLVGVTGGTPPYSWALAAGSSLPQGLRLASGADLPSNATPGTTSIVGAVHTAGDYAFDLIATDSTGATVRRTFTLRVSNIGLPQGARLPIAGQAFAQQFTGLGGTPPYTFSMEPTGLTQEMLPPGLVFTPAGLLSGTPTSTGNYGFRLTVADALGSLYSRNFGLQVNNALGLRVNNNNPNDQWVGADRNMTLFTNGPSTYTWSVAPSSLPLPPGMSLLVNDPDIGSGTALAGRVNTPGTYQFTLRATDDLNPANVADHLFTFNVSPMQLVQPAVSIPTLWRGTAGVPFSETLRVAGGTPPYTFAPLPLTPLPPGLVLSSSGVVSGMPQVTGGFVVGFRVTDGTGATLTNNFFPLAITEPGDAPSITDASNQSDMFVEGSLGNPFSFMLDQLVRGGVPPYTFTVTPGSLPPGLSVLPGTGGVPSFVGGIPTAAGEFEFGLDVTDAIGQMLSLVVGGLSVSELRVSPDSLAAGLVGSPVSVQFTAQGGSAPYIFDVVTTSDMPPGLTLSPGGLLSGTPTSPGVFVVNIRVTDNIGRELHVGLPLAFDNAAGEANALVLARTPLAITYTQTGSLPPPLTVDLAGTNGAALPFNIAVTGIPGAMLSQAAGTTPATVALTLDTPTLTSLAVGTYAGVLGVLAPGAANLYDRLPVVLTVQPPPPCVYAVNPTGGTVAASGGADSFSVSTASHCAWTATPDDPWINVTSGASGTGNGVVSFDATSHAGASARLGSITVNGSTNSPSYSLTQFGLSCSFAIVPSVLSATAAGGGASIGLSASDSACAWVASGLSASPASGMGSATVNVTVPINTLPGALVLNATIAGQLLTVNQSGIDCTVSLDPTESSFGAGGGSGSVDVTTGAACTYDTVPGPSWIAVTSGGSGTGPGTLDFSIAPNSTTEARTGSLTIGGQSFQISQAGLACSATIDTSPLGTPFGPDPAMGSILIATNGSNCTWVASSPAPWATVSPSSGTGNGAVFVSVASNGSNVSPRATSLTVAGQTIGVTQSGLSCSYGLQSTDGAVPSGGGSGSVGVIAPNVCNWGSATNDPAWLTITSSGTGGSTNVRFSAAPNVSASPRAGSLTIAGLTYTVNQAAAACSYSLTVGGASIAAAGGGGAVGFSTTTVGCTPTVMSFAGWIGATSSFSGLSGTVTFDVDPNPSAAVRTGTIQVGDRTFGITQGGTACAFSLNSYGSLFSTAGGASSVLGSPSLDPGICVPVNGTTDPTIVTLGPLTGPISNIFTQPYTVSPFPSLTFGVRLGHITFGGRIFTVKQTSW